VSVHVLAQSPHEWALAYRRDDGEQQPISPVEREFGAESLGKRQGLEVMLSLMAIWGHPERSFPSIHVAGSKGKGSTVAMLASILRAAGYRVGAYTSPSLTHFGERIEINGCPLQDTEAEVYVEELRPLLGNLPDRPRFFEAATAIAFQHFARQGVDVAVVEVGLGGRLDATNVLLPEISVITSIELEHTQILGDTLEAIAYEKAGIIKPGVPAVTAVAPSGPAGTIEQVCRERNSLLFSIGRDFQVTTVQSGITQQCIELSLGHRRVPMRLRPRWSRGCCATNSVELMNRQFGRGWPMPIGQVDWNLYPVNPKSSSMLPIHRPVLTSCDATSMTFSRIAQSCWSSGCSAINGANRSRPNWPARSIR